MSRTRILIVDDEAAIREMVSLALEMEDFECLEAGDAREAHAAVIDQRPDLVLLDWMMPGVSGVELLRRFRREELTREIPVIMLTAKGEQDNKVQGLEGGADDYVTKPFAPRELISRIRAVLRRSGDGGEEEVLRVEGLTLDMASHRLFIDDRPVDMGPTEFRLLKFFMTHRERAYTRGQLLDHVWGGNVYVEERTVDVHIRRLRKALQTDGADYSHLVQTVRGLGYRFSLTGTVQAT